MGCPPTYTDQTCGFLQREQKIKQNKKGITIGVEIDMDV
jgi:hypothetical protein